MTFRDVKCEMRERERERRERERERERGERESNVLTRIVKPEISYTVRPGTVLKRKLLNKHTKSRFTKSVGLL